MGHLKLLKMEAEMTTEMNMLDLIIPNDSDKSPVFAVAKLE